MRLTIVSVGHKMPEWVATATHDYIKRMPADCSIEIKEIKPDLTPAKEAVKIAAAIPKGSRVIALDERGKDHYLFNWWCGWFRSQSQDQCASPLATFQLHPTPCNG